MPRINYLRLKNIVLFKEAKINLNRKGISVIRGFNKDADRTSKEDNTNAAGKSLLFSALSNLILDTDPVTQAIKSRAKRDFFDKKDSEIEIEVEQDKDIYCITKKAKGKSIEYIIKKNGEDTKIRGMQNAEQKLKNLFPYSEEEFFTLYYVDSRKPNPLQFGSPAERMTFFTNLFKLHSYDEVRKQLTGMLSGLRSKDKNRLDTVNDEIDEVLHDLKSLPKEKEIEDELNTFLGKQKKYNDILSAYSEISSKYNTVKANSKNYTSFVDLCEQLGFSVLSNKDIRSTKNKVTSILSEIKKQERALKEYTQYLDDLKYYEKRKKSLVAKYKSLSSDFDKKKYTELLQSEKSLSELTLEKPYRPEYDEDRFKKVEKKIEKESEKEIENRIEKIKEKLAVLRNKKSDIESQIKNLDKLSNKSVCDTCGQAIDESHKKSTIKSLNKKLDSVIKEYDVNLKEKKHCEELLYGLQIKEKLIEYENQKTAYLKENKIRSKLESSLSQLRDLKKKKSELSDTKEQIKNLEKPDKVDKPVKNGIKEKALYENWLERASTLEPIFDLLKSTSLEDITEKYQDLKNKTSNAKNKIDTINKMIPDLSSKLEQVTQLNKRHKKLSTEKDRLEESLKDVPVLEMLVECYSNKGLKLMVIRHIAKVIEQNMNYYSPLLFKEPIKFIFEVSENQFNILMERQKGNRQPTDVRRLSGAESRAFSFLLPLSILPLIPSKQRLNIMVLDEPTVNMDNSTRELITKQFIPKLCKVVPHVVVITPLDESYNKQKEYVVVKSNGFSKLEGG